MNNIAVIGIGPGAREYVLPIALKTINECQVLIGGDRNLAIFPEFKGEKIPLPKRMEEIIQYAKENRANKKIGVVVSGDSGFYSILGLIRRNFSEEELEVIPGISALQYLFSRIKLPWQDFSLMSLHGKQANFIDEIRRVGKIALLTDAIFSPEKLADTLIIEGLANVHMVVGENLSYPEERILRGTPEAIKDGAPYQMCVVVIINE